MFMANIVDKLQYKLRTCMYQTWTQQPHTEQYFDPSTASKAIPNKHIDNRPKDKCICLINVRMHSVLVSMTTDHTTALDFHLSNYSLSVRNQSQLGYGEYSRNSNFASAWPVSPFILSHLHVSVNDTPLSGAFPLSAVFPSTGSPLFMSPPSTTLQSEQWPFSMPLPLGPLAVRHDTRNDNTTSNDIRTSSSK